jgi:hypothetical protein
MPLVRIAEGDGSIPYKQVNDFLFDLSCLNEHLGPSQ